MKTTLTLLFFLLNINLVFSQYKVEYDYKVCNSSFLMVLNRSFDKEISEKFIFNKEKSYAYYIDFETKQNVKLDFGNSKNIACVPYQYVLNYQLIDDESNVIRSFNISFFFKEGSLEMENLGNFKDFFSPYTLVIEKKLISLNTAMRIAENKNYKISTYDLENYRKNQSKIVWIFKEPVKYKDGSDFYNRVIVINAKNGKILEEYEELILR